MLIKCFQAAGLEKPFEARRKTIENVSCFVHLLTGVHSWLLTVLLSFKSTTAHVRLPAIFRFELHMKTFNPSSPPFLDLNSVHPHVSAHH